MSAPTQTKTFFADPSRLDFGRWCHTRDRQIGEGDISAAYSADRIALEGCVRSPFKWQNAMWVCTGIRTKASIRYAEAYRLVAIKFFNGEPISYHENAAMGDEARLRPEGFYHGMAVRHGKQDCVLIGPSATFLPSEDVQTPTQADLFDLL